VFQPLVPKNIRSPRCDGSDRSLALILVTPGQEFQRLLPGGWGFAITS